MLVLVVWLWQAYLHHNMSSPCRLIREKNMIKYSELWLTWDMKNEKELRLSSWHWSCSFICCEWSATWLWSQVCMEPNPRLKHIIRGVRIAVWPICNSFQSMSWHPWHFANRTLLNHFEIEHQVVQLICSTDWFVFSVSLKVSPISQAVFRTSFQDLQRDRCLRLGEQDDHEAGEPELHHEKLWPF